MTCDGGVATGPASSFCSVGALHRLDDLVEVVLFGRDHEARVTVELVVFGVVGVVVVFGQCLDEVDDAPVAAAVVIEETAGVGGAVKGLRHRFGAGGCPGDDDDNEAHAPPYSSVSVGTMTIVILLALVAAQEPALPAPTVLTAAPDASLAPPCVEVDIDDLRWRHTHGVLQAFAGQARLERIGTAVGAGALSAAMIGTAIAYVAVGKVDTQLSTIDSEDTQLAGWVVGGGALIPAAIMVTALVATSDEEQRLDTFAMPATTNEQKRARVTEAQASLTRQASSWAWIPVASGSALIAGGFASAGFGGYFILLPHLPNPRGIATHGTGAELIGAGVAALAVGIVMISSSGSTAAAQLELLDE